MATFLGYTHREDSVSADMDGFGIEERVTIMSKNPIVIGHEDKSIYKGEEIIWKYLGEVYPKEGEGIIPWTEDQMEEGVSWMSLNWGEFVYLHLWNPNKDWIQLMRVINEIGFEQVSTNIDLTYERCCKYIENKL